MEVVEDCSRTTMQAEYEVYRKITATNRKMVIILPGTPLASIAVPANKKFLELNHNEGNVLLTEYFDYTVQCDLKVYLYLCCLYVFWSINDHLQKANKTLLFGLKATYICK
jgi:hypothetical protein